MTWVFQGTVAEDGTGGTHVTSLTVTPGAGNEMQFMYGRVIAGAGAANLVTISIDDGTNNITTFASSLSLASGQELDLPLSGQPAANSQADFIPMSTIISGTMRFRIALSTATTGLTHTFACAFRIKGAVPTATLADTVGTPVLTTNTNAVF